MAKKRQKTDENLAAQLMNLLQQAPRGAINSPWMGFNYWSFDMTPKTKILAAALAATLLPMAASAATITTSTGAISDGVATPGSRTDVDNAFDGVDATFYSLGIGGWLEVDVSPLSIVSPTGIIEITFNTPNPRHPESADIYMDGLLAGSISNNGVAGDTGVNGFSLVASPTAGSTSYTLSFAGSYRVFRIEDTSVMVDPSNDGFDLSELSISAVPVPASAALLLTGLGGFAAARRKKKA